MISLVKFGLLVLITKVETKNHSCKHKLNFEGNIVGGSFADISHYPHAVFLYISKVQSKEDTFCGSSVVNQRILVTAAHCVYYDEDLSVDARAGSSDISKAKIVREVLYSMTHESYNKRTLYADIAVLMLDKNLPFGKTIKRIIIKPYFHAGIEGVVAGWGCTSEQSCKTIQHLKYLKQKVWYKEQCSRYGEVIAGTVCANRAVKTMSYPFKGDSGSGLVTKGYQLIGLVSHKLDNHSSFVIYTNVSYFMNWLRKNILTFYKYCQKHKYKKIRTTL